MRSPPPLRFINRSLYYYLFAYVICVGVVLFLFYFFHAVISAAVCSCGIIVFVVVGFTDSISLEYVPRGVGSRVSDNDAPPAPPPPYFQFFIMFVTSKYIILHTACFVFFCFFGSSFSFLSLLVPAVHFNFSFFISLYFSVPSQKMKRFFFFYFFLVLTSKILGFVYEVVCKLVCLSQSRRISRVGSSFGSLVPRGHSFLANCSTA